MIGQDAWENLTPEEQKIQLYLKQEKLLDDFLERGAISKAQYNSAVMQMLRHTKTLGTIQLDESVWKHLSEAEKEEIETICEEKLDNYYSRN